MFIVTALSREGERSGCLVGFATQTGIHPPRFLACISKENHTFDVIGSAESVIVHFLGEEQRDLAVLFGHETGDEVDKFELCSWSDGPDGIPLLDGVPGWFAGRVRDRLDLGDHVGLLLDLIDAQDRGGELNLGFQSVKNVDPGHPA
jgi:flavin reductase (DIM6/NTAB) family NADH-FMN oxidoreductase RutF